MFLQSPDCTPNLTVINGIPKHMQCFTGTSLLCGRIKQLASVAAFVCACFPDEEDNRGWSTLFKATAPSFFGFALYAAHGGALSVITPYSSCWKNKMFIRYELESYSEWWRVKHLFAFSPFKLSELWIKLILRVDDPHCNNTQDYHAEELCHILKLLCVTLISSNP